MTTLLLFTLAAAAAALDIHDLHAAEAFRADPHFCIQRNTRGACWDAGFVDHLAKAEHCQLACALDDDCVFFSYHPSRADKRCHFCSGLAEEEDVVGECRDPARGCAWGPKCCGDDCEPEYASMLEAGIARAEVLCMDPHVDADATARSAMQLNAALKTYAAGGLDGDKAFAKALPGAAARAAALIAKGGCQPTACNEGLGLWQNLRNLLALYDGHGDRAFADDDARRRLLNANHIMLADRGFLSEASVKAIDHFYGQVPAYLLSRGVLNGAPFATLTVDGAFACSGKATSAAASLAVTPRTFNTYPLQAGQAAEDPFGGTSEAGRTAGDLLLTVVRHETSHQFDRALTPRAAAVLETLKSRSHDDDDWLRESIGDAYFHDHEGEVIASQAGNQYLHDSATQFRVARAQAAVGRMLPLAWFLLIVELFAGEQGAFTSTWYGAERDARASFAHVGLARTPAGRIEAMTVPGCGTFTFSYDAEGVVEAYDGPRAACEPDFRGRRLYGAAAYDYGSEGADDVPADDEPFAYEDDTPYADGVGEGPRTAAVEAPRRLRGKL
mmetsp:Transcript_490/g.1417  ORF Transcript_490/g.1417 Transcript_490/m.1417 type:complete len:557 (-) Transcript_490:149-1819(-)